jgi:uncharacterized protein YdiU (UPF0061 family)
MNTVADARLDADFGLRWRHSFAALGADFYTELHPFELPEPYWVGRSQQVADELGLSPATMDSQAALLAFTGNLGLAGARPLASVYSGHQFGVWAGQLGDGRACLLGEVESSAAGKPVGLEIQLKGSGQTPYSRMGDGRAVLRSSIREFLCSEAMHGLGIPTTRALCVTGSDAPVRRETIESAAVVARVAPSFVRFGHFEHFAYAGQVDALRRLADHVIERFYPHCLDAEAPAGNRYAALLQAVSERTAALLAHWQAVGFCHGVMNTDNMSVLGLTIDYGPFQFLDAFVPGHICNHSDEQGRYAYNRQPNVAYWNLFCLGQALLPLIGEQDHALAALESYKTVFPHELELRMRAKLGLGEPPPGEGNLADRELIESILKLLAQDAVDYSIFWRRLSRSVAGEPKALVMDMFLDQAAAQAWLERYEARLGGWPRSEVAARMLRVNPKFVLRNHLAETAIERARAKDFSEVARLLALLERPFDEHPGMSAYADFPPAWAAAIEISCSS